MSENLFDLSGQVIILTGGAGLLGREYTKALSDSGAHVVVADLDAKAAELVAASVNGARAIPAELNVTDPVSVRELVARTLKEFGRIDGLVNNAAIDPKFDGDHFGEHRFRQQYLDHVDEPEIANPALDQYEKYQRESEMILQFIMGLLIGLILFSASMTYTWTIPGAPSATHAQAQ